MLLHFSNIFSILWPSGHIVWLIQSFQRSCILPFHRFYILSFQGYDTNFHLNPIYFLVLKSLLKKLVLRLTHIVLSRNLYIFPPKTRKLIYKLFGVKKFKMNHGQYGLTHIVVSRVLYKFLSEPHMFLGVKKFI